MTSTAVGFIKGKPAMWGWLGIWLAVASTFGIARVVTADETPSEARDGTLVAAGLSVSIRPVKMTVAETVVQIQVDGRADLGNRLADAGPVSLTDSEGIQHMIQRSSLEGRTITFSFAGSASVAPGSAKLRMSRLALTNDPIDVGPGQEKVTLVRAPILAVDIAGTGGTVRQTALAGR